MSYIIYNSAAKLTGLAGISHSWTDWWQSESNWLWHNL